MEWMALFLVALCSFGVLLGSAQLFWLLRSTPSPSPPSDGWPAVSVLKPLKGVDDGLQENLETLFTQDYPNYELLFGVEGDHDPVIPLVQNVAARYPHIPHRLFVHQGGGGLNPKISNIRAILQHPSHDILVINDSNIAVTPTYLQAMVRPLAEQPKVGLVSSLFAGTGEKTFWSFIENMYINGLLVNMLAAFLGLTQEALVIGKSNAFRRSVFERLGGFESLAYLQAEDYHMGKIFRYAGYSVVFANQVCFNRNLYTTFHTLWLRYIRWGVARSRLTPLLYPFEMLLNPLLLASVLWLWTGWSWLWGWSLLLISLRDISQWWILRGKHRWFWAWILGPFREIVYSVIWLAAPFYHTVQWRGHTLRVGAGTHLFVVYPPQEQSQEHPQEAPKRS